MPQATSSNDAAPGRRDWMSRVQLVRLGLVVLARGLVEQVVDACARSERLLHHDDSIARSRPRAPGNFGGSGDLRAGVGGDVVEGVEREVDGGFDVGPPDLVRILVSRSALDVFCHPPLGVALVRGAGESVLVAGRLQSREDGRGRLGSSAAVGHGP